MKQDDLHDLALLAGALHFCQVPAMVLFWSSVLKLGPELEKLQPITRRIVHVLSAAVVLTVLGLGCVTIAAAEEMAARSRLAVGLCSFLALFWGFRALSQCWYASVWPSSTAGRVVHALLVVLFIAKSGLYLAVAFLPLHVPVLASCDRRPVQTLHRTRCSLQRARPQPASMRSSSAIAATTPAMAS